MTKTILTSVQKQVLSILTKDRFFSKYFYLSGGTALSEYYLHHRLSDDLDFFSETEVDKIWLNSLARKIRIAIGSKEVDIQESFNRNLVYFKFSSGEIKTEFTCYPFAQIERPMFINNLKVDSLTDIAVNKFFTIYQKPTARHFIDLYLILTTKKYSWEQLKKLARIKFDTIIDPIQLGSQLIKSKTVQDMPKMLINIPESKWRDYFIEEARKLKTALA